MISETELEQVWSRVIGEYNDKPRLHWCLKYARPTIDKYGHVSCTIRDAKQCEWLKRNFLRHFQRVLKDNLAGFSGLDFLSEEEKANAQAQNERLRYYIDNLSQYWMDWGKDSVETAFSDLPTPEELDSYRRDIESCILLEMAKHPDLFMDPRFDEYHTPFYFQVIHVPGEPMSVNLTTPPSPFCADRRPEEWFKFFLDPDDTASMMDDLYDFSEAELDETIEEASCRLKEYLIVLGSSKLESWEVEQKHTFYDKMVDRWWYENWWDKNVWDEFDSFILKELPLEAEKINAFLERQYSERVRQLLLFSKKTGNKYGEYDKGGLINDIRQMFIDKIKEDAAERNGNTVEEDDEQ